jgi:cytochrome c
MGPGFCHLEVQMAQDIGAVRRLVAAGLLAVIAIPAPAVAQDGDAARGETLARQVCIACHAVSKTDKSSNPLAPPFVTIASVRGASAMALNVALLSPHRAMPNIMLEPRERADVIAYILTLKTQ